MRLTPPAIAKFISPFANALQARSTATKEDVQAVSQAIAGPFSPKI